METKPTPPTPEPAANQTPATPPPTTPGAEGARHHGLAIASFVIGIVSLLFGLLAFVGFVLGALAIVFGIISLKKTPNKAFPIIGIVTGGLAVLTNVIVTIIFIIALVFGAAAATGYTNEVSQSLNEAAEQRQALIDAKKDFAKGETATFAHFEVKVNKVTRDYAPESEFEQASEGKELIVVDLSAKNTSDESQYIYIFDFEVVANGIGESASYLEVNPAFEGGNIEPDATATGNIVFEVPADATNLKLKYTTIVTGEELVYTIAL